MTARRAVPVQPAQPPHPPRGTRPRRVRQRGQQVDRPDDQGGIQPVPEPVEQPLDAPVGQPAAEPEQRSGQHEDQRGAEAGAAQRVGEGGHRVTQPQPVQVVAVPPGQVPGQEGQPPLRVPRIPGLVRAGLLAGGTRAEAGADQAVQQLALHRRPVVLPGQPGAAGAAGPGQRHHQRAGQGHGQRAGRPGPDGLDHRPQAPRPRPGRAALQEAGRVLAGHRPQLDDGAAREHRAGRLGRLPVLGAPAGQDQRLARTERAAERDEQLPARRGLQVVEPVDHRQHAALRHQSGDRLRPVDAGVPQRRVPVRQRPLQPALHHLAGGRRGRRDQHRHRVARAAAAEQVVHQQHGQRALARPGRSGHDQPAAVPDVPGQRPDVTGVAGRDQARGLGISGARGRLPAHRERLPALQHAVVQLGRALPRHQGGQQAGHRAVPPFGGFRGQAGGRGEGAVPQFQQVTRLDLVTGEPFGQYLDRFSRRLGLAVYPAAPPGFAVESRLARSGRHRSGRHRRHRLERPAGKAGHVDQSPQLSIEIAVSRRQRRRQWQPLIAARHSSSLFGSAPKRPVISATGVVPSCPNLSQSGKGSYSGAGIPDRTGNAPGRGGPRSRA